MRVHVLYALTDSHYCASERSVLATCDTICDSYLVSAKEDTCYGHRDPDSAQKN